MRTTTLTRRTTFGAVAALTLAAAAAGVVAAPVASAASVAGTLSATTGPAGGTNTLTMTTATAKFVAGSTFVQFQGKATATSACAANFGTATAVTATAGIVNVLAPGVTPTAAGGTTKILSSTKLAITVPNTIVNATSASTQTFNVCVYNGNTTGSSSTTANVLMVNASYSVAAAPTITTISPTGGPALGGGTVTVNGTNFVTGMSAKFGSAALTNITVAANGNSFTATVPAQSSGAYNLSVTTPGGTKNKTAGNAYVPYTYSNGIVISPNTTPTATAATDIDIIGVGFASLNFTTTDGSTPGDGNAHVYVVSGGYDPTDNSSAKTVAETGECVNVLVISDTELVCTVNTLDAFDDTGNGPAIDDGTYTITVVSNGGVDVQAGGANEDANYSQSVISSGSTFTVSDY